ncbi:MAG: translation initiation factor IF-2 [Pyrinomonadaceae bacterium]|nr:translation initiation factor IF-2 [Pyrinomonadaceae bacterium]
MSLGKKIRVYDLARDLKQDTKRIIEDLRREGADVDVPSNSVSVELAEKVRNKYFPKVESSPKRAIKIIKAVKKDDEPTHSETVEETTAPMIETPAHVAEVIAPQEHITAEKETAPVTQEQKPSSQGFKVKRIVARPKEEESEEPIEIEEPTVDVPVEEETVEPVEAIEPEVIEEKTQQPEQVETVEAPIEEKIEEPVIETPQIVAPKIFRPAGINVKQLKLTKDAIQKGIKPGERVVSDAPTKTGKLDPEKARENDRKLGRRDDRKGGGRKPEFRGTPGESSTPITVYTPPSDNRRKPGRNAGKKGGKPFEDKGRFEEKEFQYQAPKSIEARILDQVGRTDSGGLKTARLTEGATVREFAEALGVTPRDIVQLLVKKGVFATLNQPIGEKMAKDLGATFGYEVSFVPFEEMVIEQEFEDLIASDTDDNEETRPPVVTVMGHVDHGKTSLLDAIRKANVAEGEAGGITQHIGAYSVYVPNPDNPKEQRRVVFLDTPGHEAFTMMRARGAKATDVVILVVAADDGVMPQTIEAVEHSKAAGVPIIVAINKIDKPDANPDKVKQGLAGLGLQPIDWGGDIEMVPVSAKKHENLDTLLETVLLTSDILDLKASPTRLASGVVLEAKLDKGRGSVATVLVQQGTLRVGDPFIVGQYYGKVRAMFSDRGEAVTEAPPATPVEVLGLQGVPGAGDTFQVVSDIDKAVTIAGQRQMHARQAAMLKTTKRGIESLGQAEVKELLVILKADVQGSVEVLRATLEKLSTEKVKVRVIRAGVGAIAESDVLLASATQADNTQTAVVIIGFNVRPESRAAEVAKQEDVDIRLHSIIYKVEEEIRAAMIGMLDAIEKENILGKAQVSETFKVSRVGTIAGCRVIDGVIRRQARARLIRDGVVTWEGDIATLKRFKDDVNEVRQGFECGISLVNFNDIKVNDEIEAYVIEKIAATEL